MGMIESIYDRLLPIMINLCSTSVVSARVCVSAGGRVMKHLQEHQKNGGSTKSKKPQRPKQTAQSASNLTLSFCTHAPRNESTSAHLCGKELVQAGGKKREKKRMCSLLVHMAIRREAKLQGLILQQQPACLLTALWAFAAAQMPRGRLTWLQLHPSVSVRLCLFHGCPAS